MFLDSDDFHNIWANTLASEWQVWSKVVGKLTASSTQSTLIFLLLAKFFTLLTLFLTTCHCCHELSARCYIMDTPGRYFTLWTHWPQNAQRDQLLRTRCVVLWGPLYVVPLFGSFRLFSGSFTKFNDFHCRPFEISHALHEKILNPSRTKNHHSRNTVVASLSQTLSSPT